MLNFQKELNKALTATEKDRGCDDNCRFHIDAQDESWTITHEAGGYKDSAQFPMDVEQKMIEARLLPMVQQRHASIKNDRAKEDLLSGGWSAVGLNSRAFSGIKDVSAFSMLRAGETLHIYRLDDDEWFYMAEGTKEDAH